MYVVIGALVIGMTLGLLGSGGSILTVPILVYLLQHDDKTAIAESLAIVGSIAAVTVVPYARRQRVAWSRVLYFGVPGMFGTYGGALVARFVPGSLQLILFACVLLLAAWLMLRGARPSVQATGVPGDAVGQPHRPAIWALVLQGLAVGVLTGLVGVGGGFLIVPALVLLGGLSMRMAVGTSLAIIVLNSWSGFFKHWNVLAQLELHVDWPTIGTFIAIGVIGSLLGQHVGTRLNTHLLRRAFAVFLVLMGLFVLSQEVPHLIPPAAEAADH